jgi:hypothetical protein
MDAKFFDLNCYQQHSNYSDNYYGTKYGKYSWNDVKHLGQHLATSKVRYPYIENVIPNKIYDYDLLLTLLNNVYLDFDKNVENVLNGFNNQMFLRFAAMFGIFKNRVNYEIAMNCWDEGFATAVYRYYNSKHKEYKDSTLGLSYVAHYDLTFSNYLYFAVGYVDQKFNTELGPLANRKFKDVHLHRFSWFTDKSVNDLKLFAMDPYIQYLQQKDFDLELKDQVFSPQSLSTS